MAKPNFFLMIAMIAALAAAATRGVHPHPAVDVGRAGQCVHGSERLKAKLSE